MLASFHSTVCVFEESVKTFIHVLLEVLEHTPDGCFGVLAFASAQPLSLGSVAAGFAGFQRRHSGCSLSRTDYPDVRGVSGVDIFVGWAVSSSVVATLVWSGCDEQNDLWSSVS